MNNSKRQFLKFIAWGTVLIPVAANARYTPFKDTAPHIKGVPQAEVGGGMTGADLSHFYKPTKVNGTLGNG